MPTFRWLHLSDLHRGMSTQGALWPNLESQLFKDLTALHETAGPWDAIFFTGDLVQRGSSSDYVKLTETLNRLYEKLAKLGSSPVLLAVPGNHDLVRPGTSPEVILLSEWSKRPDVQTEFWGNENSRYRELIKRSFENFNDWHDGHPFPRPARFQGGLLPGDFSATIEKDGLSIGVVGLNVTFLQLTEGNFEKKLAVSANQLTGVCGEHTVDWFDRHAFSFLLTHQPPSWLDRQSADELDAEIYLPGRFVAHLCGHLHEQANYAIQAGGDEAKRLWQGSSLFGLKQFGERKKVDRVHGYSAGVIDTTESGTFRLWPRKAEKHQNKYWHLVPDQSSTLEADQGTSPSPLSIRIVDRPQLPTFRVLIFSTDPDLAHARKLVAEYLRRALGIEAMEWSIENTEPIEKYDLLLLLQAWWWNGGSAAKAWIQAEVDKKLAFFVDEDSDWPPRKLTERPAESEINQFRALISQPRIFKSPEHLPEMVGQEVTEVLQKEIGDTDLGLKEWERAYLDFRLPAWKYGRTALSKVHLLDSESSDELYEADLYVTLDGTSPNWAIGSNNQPRRITSRGRGVSVVERLRMIQRRRIPLGKWLSIPDIPRLVLVGAPGGGKTIFLTRAAAALANACLGRPVDLEPDLQISDLRQQTNTLPVPVVLEATRLGNRTPVGLASLIEAISDEIACVGYHPSSAELENGLKSGRYILLFDALDEVSVTSKRIHVWDFLVGLATSLPRTRYLVTTRSAKYTGRLKFGKEIEVVEVAPLNKPQVNQLCTNWCRYRHRDEEFTNSLMSAVSGLGEQIASSGEDQSLTENPLMLTAICMVFEKYRSLPDDRGRLCDLLIDDLCRSRLSEDSEHGWKLDDAGKKDLLQRIALAMQEDGAQTWPVSRAIEIALTILPNDELRQQRSKKYIDWTADHTGLLRFQPGPDGSEHVRFWHRIFREYLSANRLAQLDTTAGDKIKHLWKTGHLYNPFWEDVVRLLPRTLGTLEKAKSLLKELEKLATEYPKQRGRLLGLAAACIIENRDLFPHVDPNVMAQEMAKLYETHGLSWPVLDRLLFLEGLGRLDSSLGDPRLVGERWIAIKERSGAVPAFWMAWAPVTVQEFWNFLKTPEAFDTRFWDHLDPDRRPDASGLLQRIRRQTRRPNYPVVDVTLFEAIAFCRWKTSLRQDGKIVNVPSETAWQIVKELLGPFEDLWGGASPHEGDLAELNWVGAGLGRPSPIGTFKPELGGLVDVIGNVWSWVNKKAEEIGPEHTASVMTIQGGSFADEAEAIKSFFTALNLPEQPYNIWISSIGFRCILADKNTEAALNPGWTFV